MTPTDKQLCRENILRQCAASGALGLPLGTIQRGLIVGGFRLTTDQVETELHYLVEKGLLRRETAALSAGLGRWVVTAAAIERLEAEGLL